jgi:hypothetical protein
MYYLWTAYVCTFQVWKLTMTTIKISWMICQTQSMIWTEEYWLLIKTLRRGRNITARAYPKGCEVWEESHISFTSVQILTVPKLVFYIVMYSVQDRQTILHHSLSCWAYSNCHFFSRCAISGVLWVNIAIVFIHPSPHNFVFSVGWQT